MAHALNGCSQSSRFPPQARRIVGSGDENGSSLIGSLIKVTKSSWNQKWKTVLFRLRSTITNKKYLRDSDTKYWQLFMVMVNTLWKMWTIKSFQNKEYACSDCPAYSPGRGCEDRDFQRIPRLPGNQHELSASEVKAPQSPAKARMGGCGGFKWLLHKL